MTNAIASDMLRSYIDRILRLKAEQDDLTADIREIYAEAKSNGFDKTRLGEVVAYIRKRDKKGATEVAEADAIFDLYLSTYDGKASHAHAREATISVSALPIVTAAPDLAAEESVGTDTSLVPEHKATPVVVAEPAPRQEQAGTDTSLGDDTAFTSAAVVVSTAKPATAAKEAAGTHSEDDEDVPDFLWRGSPRVSATEQGRG